MITYEEFKELDLPHLSQITVTVGNNDYQCLCLKSAPRTYVLLFTQDFPKGWDVTSRRMVYDLTCKNEVDTNVWCKGWHVGGDLIELRITRIELSSEKLIERYLKIYGPFR